MIKLLQNLKNSDSINTLIYVIGIYRYLFSIKYEILLYFILF